MADYSALDRLLHRLALQVRPIAEASFDLDQQGLKSVPEQTAHQGHVFISGLARAGTTILMRRFHATGDFCSLTYRHMPFVLAPRLWGKLSAGMKRDVTAHERAHGDGIRVDADSPESLDEVFWRVLDGEGYIAKTHLAPHTPDDETAQKFIAYVAAILSTTDRPDARYLSKNNNNILRLTTIRRLFPRALILLPFREPLTHATSLWRQHAHFSEVQRQDAFVRAYMTWLAHHEFGGDHRPFRFDAAGAARLARFDPRKMDYWLELWRQSYLWLERTAPPDAVFVCYEDLCGRAETLDRLLDMADVTDASANAEPLRLSRVTAEQPTDPALAEETSQLYDRLRQRSRAALESQPA
ncbi:MAG: sulfotransferase [Thiohalocapsa sp.]|uniref:sulfotransferase n=1 Tax=Thiohalocapsa sp. TaxID=2497641 RepID=UPI0025D37B3C|nr:sulfotransferase [Thiohalocapsa sp.]MCG6942107.1 sulfotransferase [Thiohalocapsa sp.]